MPADSHSVVVCAGILVADLFVPPIAGLPGAGELMVTDDFLIDSGGCAANTATSLEKLGVPACVLGKVGQDFFGEFIEQDLRRKGVEITAISRSASHGTSKTVILPVIGEDRRYIHTFGANADFRGDDIPEQLLARARVFYLGGFLALPRLTQADLSRAMQIAHGHGAITVLDVIVPAGNKHASLAALEAVLPEIDFFLPNEEEARALTGLTSPHQQAQRFLQAGCGTVIITMGAGGALLMDAQQTIELPAVPVEVVDGSGAGDAFAAGFIVGLLEAWEPAQALRFASVIGASACTRLGCTTGVFTRAQAAAYLEKYPLRIRKANGSG